MLPGRENLVRVELRGGARMDVRVLDPDGKPCRRARVKVTFPDLRKPNPVAGIGFNQDRQVVSKTYHTGTVKVEALRRVDGEVAEELAAAVDAAEAAPLPRPEDVLSDVYVEA